MKSGLHDWQLTPREAVDLQRILAQSVEEKPLAEDVRLIAGADCGYDRQTDRIIATAVVFNAGCWEVLEEKVVSQPSIFPYIPGLLSFREAPAVIEVVNKLNVKPDLLLCDGQGRAHPRRLGLASHVGLWLEMPVVGVAKSCLCGSYRMPGKKKGCNTRLVDKGETVGRVVRTRYAVKPLFVSVGHLVTLDDAVRWTLRSARKYRLPEPARQAHLLTRQGACPEKRKSG